MKRRDMDYNFLLIFLARDSDKKGNEQRPQNEQQDTHNDFWRIKKIIYHQEYRGYECIKLPERTHLLLSVQIGRAHV